MKTIIKTTGAAIAVSLAISAAAGTVVRQEPLKWEAVHGLEGPALYATLCASCHGMDGSGNGPAASHIDKNVPELTGFTAANDGAFPHKRLENAIYGSSREPHAGLDMPAWGHQFLYARSGWNNFLRESFARERIHTLTTYIESIQQ